MSEIIAKLRNPAYAPNDNRRTILHASQVLADMEAAAAEIERLQAALLRHGRHTNDCPWSHGHDCLCGIEEIRRDLGRS